MAWKYNPFTDALDQTGSGGGSYIDGEVEYHSNLPVTVGTPAVNSAFLVRKGEGLYFISRKPAGIWVRELNNGNLDDWKFAGLFSDLYRDANFRIISDSDVSKELAFSLSAITTGTTRTITVPNKNLTLDDAGDSRTPSSHAASHAAGVKASFNGQVAGMTANVFIRANNVGTAGNSITLTFDGVDDIDAVLAAWNSANPSNQATLISGDGAQVPDNLEEITLSGGTAAGSDPAFDQNLNTSNSPTFNKLTLTADQSDSSLKLGTLEFQGYALNNAWIGDNVYFNGSDFKRRATGAATLFYFQGAEGQFRCDVSNNAGSSVTSNPAFKVGAGGKFSAGANVSNVGDFEAGMLYSDGNNIGFSDKTDNTKKATLDLSGITSGETRNLELPDASGTLALTSQIPAAGVTSVTGTAPIVSSGGTTPAISVTVGTGANTVCAGDDARLSDARTPTSHSHGNITNAGAIGSTAGLLVVTTTSGALTTLTLGAANTVLKVNSGGTAVEFGAAGGVTSGSVDNAILRADGTGGSTSQGSAINVEDASTTTLNNVALTNQHSGQTNSALVLQPKGTGQFIVSTARPDGTAAGGAARGARAIDISLGSRSNANRVAAGTDSVVVGNDSSAGSYSVSLGYQCLGGATSTVIGDSNTLGNESVAIGTFVCQNGAARAVIIGGSSGTNGVTSDAVVVGYGSVASAGIATAIGRGVTASLRAQFATNAFSSIFWAGQTTNNTATILNLNGEATNRFTIAASTALAVDILLVARRTGTQDKWLVARRFLGIRRDGSNNTSLIGAVQTLGTDQSAGSPTWTFALTADDTNEALQLEVTGATGETVEWRATAFYRVA